MGNGYFNHDAQLSPGTKARAEDVNVRFNGTVLGFDHLPDPHPTKQGFGEPVPMSNATALDEGATAGQIVGSLLTYGVDTGAANAYVVTLPVAPAAYANGVRVLFRAINANTGASTINLNDMGIKAFTTQSGAALLANDILAGMLVEAVYDDGKFKIVSHFNQYDGSAETYALNALESAADSQDSADDSLAYANQSAGYRDQSQAYRDQAQVYQAATLVNHATFLKYQW